MRRFLRFVIFLVVLFAAKRASAETLQAPVGGKAIPLGPDRIACGVAPGGWTIEKDGHSARPPAADDAAGKPVELRVAKESVGCAGGGAPITLLATARFPAIDAASLVLHVDEARAELRGKKMKGIRLVWDAGGRKDDACVDPKTDANGELCTFGIGRKLPANPSMTFAWLPAGASADESAILYDAEARRVAPSELALKPARIIVASIFPAGATLDLARGTAKLPLSHPEAVTTLDCAPAFCDVEDGALVVRGVTSTTATLRVRARLLPRVLLGKGDTTEASPLLEIPVLRCPMTIISGDPLADVDDARVVVKLEGTCADDVHALRFFAGASPAEVVRIDPGKGFARAVLRVGRLDDEVTIRAVRGEGEGTLAAAVKAKTQRIGSVNATLELDSGVPIDFIPSNRDAIVHVVPPADGLRAVLLPVEGVYTVIDQGGVQRVRSVGPPGGIVSLRFAIRSASLEGDLGATNLGVVRDSVQRPMHAGNVAASLAGVVEMRCVDRRGNTRTIAPGLTVQVPYAERDGCFIAMHKDKLPPEDGIQKLVLDIDVSRLDGTARPEAHLSEQTSLRPASGTRINFIKGAKDPFDRVVVRVAHAQDEQHYAAKSEQPLTPPAEQWALTMGTASARMYLTAAIPTVLYRVSEAKSSGILSLNFGVLGRLTWVDADGFDGILALEGGVLGVGLAPVDTSASGQSLSQVASVFGIGLGVPIVNRAAITQTSINLHAWFEYEISRTLGGVGSPFGFVFGPSITFGNVGTYL
jgi:hypothetical protein